MFANDIGRENHQDKLSLGECHLQEVPQIKAKIMSKPINDGGPAFSQPNHLVDTERGREEARGWMQDSGMSLRAWLAGQALANLRPKDFPDLDNSEFFKDGAKYCVAYADAVIAELAKP